MKRQLFLRLDPALYNALTQELRGPGDNLPSRVRHLIEGNLDHPEAKIRKYGTNTKTLTVQVPEWLHIYALKKGGATWVKDILATQLL